MKTLKTDYRTSVTAAISKQQIFSSEGFLEQLEDEAPQTRAISLRLGKLDQIWKYK